MQHRVERRRLPVDRLYLAGVRVGHGIGGLATTGGHTAVAASAVEATFGRRREQLRAPAWESFLVPTTCAGLAGGFHDPVQGQRDRAHHEHCEAEDLHSFEAFTFQTFVVVVRLAVRREFDLGAEFGPASAHVEPQIHHPPADEGEADDPRNCRGDCCEHQCPPADPMQCGPSAS